MVLTFCNSRNNFFWNFLFLEFQKVSTIQTYISAFYLSYHIINSISHLLWKLDRPKETSARQESDKCSMPLKYNLRINNSYFLVHEK